MIRGNHQIGRNLRGRDTWSGRYFLTEQPMVVVSGLQYMLLRLVCPIESMPCPGSNGTRRSGGSLPQTSRHSCTILGCAAVRENASFTRLSGRQQRARIRLISRRLAATAPFFFSVQIWRTPVGARGLHLTAHHRYFSSRTCKSWSRH